MFFGETHKGNSLCFHGPIGSGAKTHLIWALVNEKGSFNECLICTYTNIPHRKDIIMNKEKIRLFLIDTNGQKKIILNFSQYQKMSDIIVFGYDITDKKSFEELKDIWVTKFYEKDNNKIYYLVGNKVDLVDKREVSKEEAEEFALANNFTFFEVSAFYYINVHELLSDFILKSQTIKNPKYV